MKEIKLICPKCKKIVWIKIEFGRSMIDMIKNQHKCKKERA
jgi:hypothetical protein